jgi:ribosomal protein S13
MIRNNGRLRAYPLYWYLSNKGRLKFMGMEANKVYKEFSVSHHLHHLFYGLGDGLSYSTSWHMGVNINVNFKHLANFQFMRYKTSFTRRNMKFGYVLKNYEIYIFKRLFKIRCRRGIRLLRGFPVHGQRTHTNAMSAYRLAKIRRKEVFSSKVKLIGTRAQRKARYLARLQRAKDLRLKKGRMKVRLLLKAAKKKRKQKEKARAWIMSKQKKQMERARKRWQAVAAKKKQQRFKKW